MWCRLSICVSVLDLAQFLRIMNDYDKSMNDVHVYYICIKVSCLREQDKSSDIEQQPPFGDRIYSNTQTQNRGVKTNGNIIY